MEKRKKIKISARAREEFEFLSRCGLDMIGRVVGHAPEKNHPDGYSALECWFFMDTHGIALPCSDHEELQRIFRAKKSVNLQVRLWAEDLADGSLLTPLELFSRHLAGWPQWVFEAALAQARKICMNNPMIGFFPTFLGCSVFLGAFWSSDMDYFDPGI